MQTSLQSPSYLESAIGLSSFYVFFLSATFLFLKFIDQCKFKYYLEDVEEEEEEEEEVEVEEEEEEEVEEEVEEEEEEEVEEEEEEVEEENIYKEMDETEELLEKQLDRLYQMNRIEKLSLLIEEEKQKGELPDRLSIVDNKQLIYKFHINDFNRFRVSVYDEFKNNSRCKKQSVIMKKIGKAWKELSDEDKMMYTL
jgi:flagellar biosynthesis component FlhA